MYKQLFERLAAPIALSGIVLQYIASSQLKALSLIEFYSYFTILTNTLVAAYFVSSLFPKSQIYRFLHRPETATAITVYIAVVGLVYQTLLRNLYKPEGLFIISDNLVHGLVPMMMLVYWFLYIRKQTINIHNIPKWLMYPALFLCYSLVRGAYTHWYPYPFLNVDDLGYTKVLLNSSAICLLFLGLSYGFYALSRLHAQQTQST